MSTYAIIVSAGKGVRMNGATPKQYLPLQGMPIFCHTVLAFERCPEVDHIVLLVPDQDIEFCHERLFSHMTLNTPVRILSGGKRRQDSVFNGILSIDDPGSIVVIHDGVRPLIRSEMIAQCIMVAQSTGACILGIPLQDTLKRVDSHDRIQGTIDRSGLWLAQTPQVFQYRLIREAHEAARQEGIDVTDDAALLERMGVPIRVLKGSKDNIKITTRKDLILAEALLGKVNTEDDVARA